MARSRNLIIIPAFNEEKTIAAVVKGCLTVADVLVVDDCSQDQTAKLAQSAGAIVLSKIENQGYTKALEAGFKKAAEMNYSMVVTLDADGQHDTTLAQTFFEALDKDGFDLVLGVRPRSARISEALLCLYFRQRFGVSDILCGMKGYNLNLYQKIGFFDSIESVGTELSMRYIKLGARWKELPVPIKERADAPRFGSSLQANIKITRAFIRLICLDMIT